MKFNNKGYSLIQVMLIMVTLIGIVTSITGVTTEFKNNIGVKKISSLAVSDTITNVSNYIYNTGGIVYTDEYIDTNSNLISPSGIKDGVNLNEDFNLSLNLSKNVFDNMDGKLLIQLNQGLINPNSFLGVDVNSINENIPNYSFDNGIIINDTSYWTDFDQSSNLEYQLTLLKEQKYKELATFISQESEKLNKPGTFLLFDLGKKIYINTFSFNLANRDTSLLKPKILSLTFDNGTKYNFGLNEDIIDSKFTFVDTKTRFVKVDYIVDNSGATDLNNTIMSGLATLSNDDITYSGETTDTLEIDYPSVGASNVKYYELYFSDVDIKPNNPTITVPQQIGNIKVYYDISNEGIKPNYLWIDICGLNNVCLTHESHDLPKEIIY